MKSWTLIDTAKIAGSDTALELCQSDDAFSIRLSGGEELMNSRAHGSEDALGELVCKIVRNRKKNLNVLVGGLGLGFTLAAALKTLKDSARVTVAEMIPEIVEWNKGPLAELNGHALNDARVHVHQGNMSRLLKNINTYDAMMWDLDNGPEGANSKVNSWLYSHAGLKAAHESLTAGGVLGIWSVGPDKVFVNRLRRAGFKVEEKRVRAHGNKGAHYLIWIARKGR